eukprot:7935289-Ditylum_brightwellii.AAC.2
MAFVTMNLTSATLSSSQEARSAHILYYGTAEAPADLVCKRRQKARKKTQPDRQRSQGPERVHQRQDQ